MNSKLLILIVLCLVAAGCRPAAQPLPPKELAYFSPLEVCGFPSNAPAKTFSRLGGGKWATDGSGSGFECDGSRGIVQLYNLDGLAINVNYAATGVEKGASMISIDYAASGGRPIPNENTYRTVFANLIEAVCRQGLNAIPTDLFRKKLLNLNSYDGPGQGGAEVFDVGSGFLTLNREASADKLSINISVKVYPDVGFKLER